MTDQLGRITTFTYDSHGNMTVVEDPLTNVTTYTYSSTQPGMLTAQTAPAPAGTSSYTLVSYQYDSQGSADDHHQRRQRRDGKRPITAPAR